MLHSAVVQLFVDIKVATVFPILVTGLATSHYS